MLNRNEYTWHFQLAEYCFVPSLEDINIMDDKEKKVIGSKSCVRGFFSEKAPAHPQN